MDASVENGENLWARGVMGYAYNSERKYDGYSVVIWVE